jgi:hypothetical protein
MTVGSVLGWWIALYYPLIFLLIGIGNYFSKRLATDPAKRRADMALGCAFMVLVAGPLIINIGQIAYHAMTQP